MRELKKMLRKELIERRKMMSDSEKNIADTDIFEQVKPFLDRASSVFTYASTSIEVDTRSIIDYCLQCSIPVALPVSGDEDIMFYYIKSTEELSKGRFNIDEPPEKFPAVADSDTLCIVPALCADGNGLRLGYGRGYYDRFLAHFIGKSVIICYKTFKREVPSEKHDIKAEFTIFNR